MDGSTASNREQTAAILRRALVARLVDAGVLTDAWVEAAFLAVPRHLFLPEMPLERVYQDEAIPTRLRDGEPISSSSQPAVMALMLEQLRLESGQRVLEIGAGAGFNAALMAHLVGPAGEVVTVDIDDDIVEDARQHLTVAGYERVRVVCGDGALGYAEHAPYDRIILTVGAWDILPAWWEQLAPGGRLVLPLSLGGPQACVAFVQMGDHLASESVKPCGFMRLRGPFQGPEAVVPLGPRPGLRLFTEGDPVDAPRVYDWLAGPCRELPATIRIGGGWLCGGLESWLAPRDPGFITMMAGAEAAERGEALSLFLAPGGFRRTFGLLRPDGLALLGPAQPSIEAEPATGQTSIDLRVRGFGPDPGAAAELLAHIQAWDAAGQPDLERLRIRVDRLDAPARGVPADALITRRWTRLALTWD